MYVAVAYIKKNLAIHRHAEKKKRSSTVYLEAI